MKTKKFTKLISVLLVLSMLLTFGTIVASADGGTSTGTSSSSASTAFKLDNGDITTVDNNTGYYSSNTIKYYGTHWNTAGSDPYQGYTAGAMTELQAAGKFDDSQHRYQLSTGDEWMYAKEFQVNFHIGVAVGFTAPEAGFYQFDYQYGMTALNDICPGYKLLIGKSFTMAGNKTATESSALHVDTFTNNTSVLGENTFEVKLNKGETLYFLIMNPNNCGYGQFWLKKVEQKSKVEENPTSWYFGDINYFGGFIDDDVIDYVYYHQGTHDGIATPRGVYPMTFSDDRYIIGEQTKDDETTTTVSNSYVRSGGMVAPQYWYTPGLAFKAPYTGTVKFTVQTKIPNEEHNLVVGRSTVDMVVDNGHSDGIIHRSLPADAVNTVVERTFTLDVTKNESIYFLIDNLSFGFETKLQLKSAEYVYGDLNKNPVTFVAAQETDAYTNGSGEAFDVRFISAVSKNADVTRNIGFNYSVTINGATAADNVSYTMNETYKKLTANTEKGIEEISAPQGTSFMAGVLTLPASGTVVITITSWAETADGTYNDTACQITYENGAFVSMKNLIND